jgi:hypothetical protein
MVTVAVEGGPVHRFRLVDVGTFTERIVGDLVSEAEEGSPPVLVTYRRASANARAALRAAGASYVGEDGRALLHAPGLLVDRDDRALPRSQSDADLLPVDDVMRGRNPFATRGSRVARWLLMHPREEFSVSDLARDVELSAPAVSRVLQVLEDRVLVTGADVERDARRHQVVLKQPRRLLDAWAPHWARRRIRQRRWDIGARDAEDALAQLRSAAGADVQPRWRVGGLAGASFVRRAVEPADVLLWVDDGDVGALAELLQPEPARGGNPGRGTLRVAVAPDPWVLGLQVRPQLIDDPAAAPWIADPVQLWLDCVTEGERALEAADAVAEALGW